MAQKQKHTPVIFENSRGETITNDPIYKAQQTLRDAGVDVDESPEDESPEEEESDLEDAGASDEGDDLDQLDGKALKALAAERGVDISGLKKVGEVRQALRDAASE